MYFIEFKDSIAKCNNKYERIYVDMKLVDNDE